MEKIMVTGGTGYIGSHTIIELLKRGGLEVFSVDSCVRSTPETIDRIEKITGKKVKNYQIDICDKEKLFHVLEQEKGTTGVIHFAALKSVPESVEKPLEYYRNNLESLSNVLEACQQFNIPNFIFSSSCSIYGDVKDLPVDESTPVGVPFCSYAHTKQIGEEMVRFFAEIHPKLKSVILRYFNPVGSDMSGMNGELSPDKPNNLMPIITQVGIGRMEKMTVYGTDYDTRDGSCIRDYIHVSDIANAHINAFEFLFDNKNKSNLEVFNLGSGKGVTVLEMINAFEKITGVKLNYALGDRRPGDIPAIYSNSGKAEKELGWRCRHSLDDMIESAWKWENYLKNNPKV
ncbi:UDP-glucose 4-epimerase GalE [Bacteroidales bacterium OttesenSCG-928-B11]|nr:UDP-glucose 4-epimerase GalE [Bacteroidales bacterium OttesenSCG-928-E04]MDL2311975.1 UDP-glucose 4-epimerase GalE [Bacteroidales bacterium OttesenSCG-928-B11]